MINTLQVSAGVHVNRRGHLWWDWKTKQVFTKKVAGALHIPGRLTGECNFLSVTELQDDYCGIMASDGRDTVYYFLHPRGRTEYSIKGRYGSRNVVQGWQQFIELVLFGNNNHLKRLYGPLSCFVLSLMSSSTLLQKPVRGAVKQRNDVLNCEFKYESEGRGELTIEDEQIGVTLKRFAVTEIRHRIEHHKVN